MAIFGPIWTQFRSGRSGRSEMAFWPNFKLFRPKLSPNRTKNGHFSLKHKLFSFLTCKFDYFRSHFSIFEYRILYRTCFAKFPRIRKYRIYSGLNSNMKKKLFRLSRKWKIRKKILSHCLKLIVSGFRLD